MVDPNKPGPLLATLDASAGGGGSALSASSRVPVLGGPGLAGGPLLGGARLVGGADTLGGDP